MTEYTYDKHLTLGEVIEFLENETDLDRKVPYGFAGAHSWRGSFREISFEPAGDVTIRSMLDETKAAVGETFTGYKGGDFLMTETTPVHIAHYGQTGEEGCDNYCHEGKSNITVTRMAAILALTSKDRDDG